MNKNLFSGPRDFEAKVPQVSLPSDCVAVGDLENSKNTSSFKQAQRRSQETID